MQMNVAGLRRNIKNLAHNYSDAQVSLMTDKLSPPITLSMMRYSNIIMTKQFHYIR